MKIQSFGDSLEWGYDGSIGPTDYTYGAWELAPAGYLPRVASPAPSYLAQLGTVINCAVGGQSTARCIAGQAAGALTTDGHFPSVTTPAVAPFATLLDPTADIVILAHGLLDAREVSVATYKQNLRIMRDAAALNGSEVIFRTPTKSVLAGWTGDVPAYAQGMREVAAEDASHVADAWAFTQNFDLSVAAPMDSVHYTQEYLTRLGHFVMLSILNRNIPPLSNAAPLVAALY